MESLRMTKKRIREFCGALEMIQTLNLVPEEKFAVIEYALACALWKKRVTRNEFMRWMKEGEELWFLKGREMRVRNAMQISEKLRVVNEKEKPLDLAKLIESIQ
jgi:hypothetical protein